MELYILFVYNHNKSPSITQFSSCTTGDHHMALFPLYPVREDSLGKGDLGQHQQVYHVSVYFQRGVFYHSLLTSSSIVHQDVNL